MEQNQIETTISKEEMLINNLRSRASSFLGDEVHFINESVVSNITDSVVNTIPSVKENMENGDGKIVTYDKYKKTFSIENEKNVSIGGIVSARRLGINFKIPESIESSGDGKKIRRLVTESILNDHLYQQLNKELATTLSESAKNKDALLSKAYSELAKRSGIENRQTGVFAEQIIIGILEGFAIDHPELGFTIQEANAYQDVNNKIDFIIHTKEKKKGVGINRLEKEFDEKSIGIQFTINKNAEEHKKDQIKKAQARGLEVDDILYVDLDKRILEKAITDWEKSGKPIVGPWKYLPMELRKSVLKNLFNKSLNEEQEKALQKINEKNF